MNALGAKFKEMKRILMHLVLLVSAGSACGQDFDPSFDHNGDGCVGTADLVALLGYYGSCDAWQCGDALNYWGYAYETVEMGSQCWFAENLTTELYANGDSIPAGLNGPSWTSTEDGAVAVYGEGSSFCTYYTTEAGWWICDDSQSVLVFGRLYNWHATADSRGLCPSGWHVPSYWEFSDLESHVVQQGFATGVGSVLKTTSGWDEDGNGTDDFGFSVPPAGRRDHFAGNFSLGERYGYFWTSTSSGTSQAYATFLSYDSDDVDQDASYVRNGHSIRCVMD